MTDLTVVAKPLALALAAAVGAFFNVPAFYALLGILFLDWLSGVNRARVKKDLCSSKLGIAFEKAFHYTVLFTGMHCVSLFVMPQFLLVEQAILIGLALKELLSIVENIKAVQIMRGQNNKVIDKLIEILGLDVDKILIQLSKRD